MTSYQPYLDWLDTQHQEMTLLLMQWAQINSGTHNLAGLNLMKEHLRVAFGDITDGACEREVEPLATINAHGEVDQQPLGAALHLTRRAESPITALLAIHMDTVYGPDSSFQDSQMIEPNKLSGPGVADAKGGLVVMLYALRALERFVAATGCDRLGWQVLINADEEIGSPGSAPLFQELASYVDFALLYEPALPTGELVAARKGSGNFSIVLRGQAAHAGREFERGRNAVVAAADVAQRLHALNRVWPGVTVNVARIDGGGPENVVPDVAVVRLNIRYAQEGQEQQLALALAEIISEAQQQEGITARLHGHFSAPVKPYDASLQQLLGWVAECGQTLGIPIAWQDTGGVCDGNRLAAYGVPNVDTMGVQGGNIHSTGEYVLLDSLGQRAKLTALLLMRVADGSLTLPLPATSSK